MGKILVIGSSNTDMVVKSGRFPTPGETILGGAFYMFPGGKGANQAVAAARLGGQVTFITKIGDDLFGKNALSEFEKEGIDTSFVMIDEEQPSGVALINVNNQGENQIVVASGANGYLLPHHIDTGGSIFTSSDIILVQLEIPLKTVEHIIAKAKAFNKKVILNPAPAQTVSEEALQGLYCITPNQSEAALLTGLEVKDEESARQAAMILVERGVNHVIITMGAKGALYMSQNDDFLTEANPVEVVDTTAAGDVFNGALSFALASDKGWQESIAFANRAAALSVTRMGAQASAPYKHELQG